MDLYVDNYKKKSKCKPREDQPANEIQNLPHEIALDILARLPITSLLQSRFVCEAWKKLSFDKNLVKLHLSQEATQNPYLIFHCDYPIQNHLYFAELSGLNENQKLRKFHTPFFASMPEFTVVGSCNGLLCLSGSLHSDALIIYNPFTRDYKELPKSISYKEQVVVVGFGYHPVINEYKVVKVSYNWGRTKRYSRQSEVQILSVRSNTWKRIGKSPYTFDKPESQAVLNGRIHWLGRPMTRIGRYYRIVAFDLADEQFHKVPGPNFSGRYRPGYQLAVMGGCLSAIVDYGRQEKLEIWIMREYNEKESWIIEYRIRDFFPRLLRQDFLKPCQIWTNSLHRRKVRVVCVLKNGDILLESKYGTLASYNLENGNFRERMFRGMPTMFQANLHTGSLNWIDVRMDV